MKSHIEIIRTNTNFPKLTIAKDRVSMKFPVNFTMNQEKIVTDFFNQVLLKANEIGFINTLRGAIYDGHISMIDSAKNEIFSMSYENHH